MVQLEQDDAGRKAGRQSDEVRVVFRQTVSTSDLGRCRPCVYLHLDAAGTRDATYRIRLTRESRVDRSESSEDRIQSGESGEASCRRGLRKERNTGITRVVRRSGQSC